MPGQILLYPRAGDCVVAHANLWHRTDPDHGRCGRRRLVLFGYEPSWSKSAVARGVKPDEPLTAPMRLSAHEPLRELLDEWNW